MNSLVNMFHHFLNHSANNFFQLLADIQAIFELNSNGAESSLHDQMFQNVQLLHDHDQIHENMNNEMMNNMEHFNPPPSFF